MSALDPMSATMRPALFAVAQSNVRDIPLETLVVPEERRALVNEDFLALLEPSIERVGLECPIGAYKGEGVSWHLIWGLHRLVVFERKFAAGLRRFEESGDASERDRWAKIPCRLFTKPIPPELARLFEIEENLLRREISSLERSTWSVEVGNLLKTDALTQLWTDGDSRAMTDNQMTENQNPSNPKGGGRKKGWIQKVAEILGVDHSAVRRHAKKISKLIGEPVDIENDSPEELRRKAQLASKMIAEQAKAKKKKHRGKSITAHLFDRDPDPLIAWIDRRVKKGDMTLADVIAYRDALVDFVRDLERSKS
jgi:hypothetical protein